MNNSVTDFKFLYQIVIFNVLYIYIYRDKNYYVRIDNMIFDMPILFDTKIRDLKQYSNIILSILEVTVHKRTRVVHES